MLRMPSDWDDWVHRHPARRPRDFSFRWYYPRRALEWAPAEGKQFSELIVSLKHRDIAAFRLFREVLERSWPTEDPSTCAIACAPRHSAALPNVLSDLCWKLGQARGVVDLGENLVRAFDVEAHADRDSTDSQEQLDSIEFRGAVPQSVREILILDDVRTSGATLNACRAHAEQAAPRARVLTLAFGKNQRTGETPFPRRPNFEEILRRNLEAYR